MQIEVQNPSAVRRFKQSAPGRALNAAWREVRTLFYAKQLLTPGSTGLMRAVKRSPADQQATRFTVPPEASLGETASFASWICPDQRCPEGVDAFYLTPEHWRASRLSHVARRYPPTSGLKVSKNLGGLNGFYMTSRPGRHIQRWLSGSHSDQVHTYNHLYLEGIAPRLWDVMEIIDGEGHVRVAYVVDHVTGSAPAPAEFQAVVGQLQHLCQETRAVLVSGSGWRGIDFQLPDGNGNVITCEHDGRPRYVDIHSFKVTAGPVARAPLAKAAGLSRSSRDDDLCSLLHQAGVSLQRKLVLDLLPEDGRSALSYLRAGARWVHASQLDSSPGNIEETCLLAGQTRLSVSRGKSLRAALQGLPPHLDAYRPSEILLETTEDAICSHWSQIRRAAWRYLVVRQGCGERLASVDIAKTATKLTETGSLQLWERKPS